MDRRTLLRTLMLGAGGLAVHRRGLAAQAPVDAAVVTTTAGRLRGAREDGLFVFKGVRYGADTYGRRFQKPAAVKSWSGVRDAVQFGKHAPQPDRGSAISEDCLHLNVWSPGLRDGAKRPVMVWFHGGGYTSGTSNAVESHGARLSRRGDVVVVTVNHRLNVFGFLYLADLGGSDFADSGNAGMLDLVLALQWVRDNIAEFGGDPGLVTIFGESGGGAKCTTLMAMPAARGLFHRVIAMSGQQIMGVRPDVATRSASRLLAAMRVTPEDLHDVRMLPLDHIVRVSRAAQYLAPVRDGRSLPRDPFDPDAPPQCAGIPMMIGGTRGETRTQLGRADPSLFSLTWDALLPKLAAYPAMGDLDRAAVIAQYRRVHPDFTPTDVFFAATTDVRWRSQVIVLERRASQPAGSAPTYLYQLDWRTPVDGGKWGAHHELDVPLAFDNAELMPNIVGTGDDARQLGAMMADAFIAFARTGDPNVSSAPQWPAYDLTRRATMVFDTELRVVDDPRGAERRLFEKVPYVAPGTSS